MWADAGATCPRFFFCLLAYPFFFFFFFFFKFRIPFRRSLWIRRFRPQSSPGASGGIGYELAKLFARDHYRLVLVARSVDKLSPQVASELEKQYGATVKTIALDLSDPSAPK